MWSGDLDALDARIVAASRALGHEDTIDDVLVIGYSQNALRAESLVRKWPQRYTQLILMAGPTIAAPRKLSALRGAVAMADERNRRDLIETSARVLSAASIPTTFIVIPQATHGTLGPTPEETMDAALDW